MEQKRKCVQCGFYGRLCLDCELLERREFVHLIREVLGTLEAKDAMTPEAWNRVVSALQHPGAK